MGGIGHIGGGREEPVKQVGRPQQVSQHGGAFLGSCVQHAQHHGRDLGVQQVVEGVAAEQLQALRKGSALRDTWGASAGSFAPCMQSLIRTWGLGSCSG